jgi:hypothetical protein
MRDLLDEPAECGEFPIPAPRYHHRMFGHTPPPYP